MVPTSTRAESADSAAIDLPLAPDEIVGTGLPAASAADTGKSGLPTGSVVAAPVHRDATGRIVPTEEKPETCQKAQPASVSADLKSVDIVMLGASITAGWDKEVWQRHFGKDSVLNEAGNGGRTGDILEQVSKEGLKANPKLVILLGGSNDLAFGEPPGSPTANIRAIVRKICSLAPTTKILLLGILPRGTEGTNGMRVKIKAENQRLAKVADSKFIYYLDVGSVLLEPNGDMSPEISPDSMHFSQRGYELLATAIQPTVETLLAKSH